MVDATERRVRELTARVQRIHNGDCVTLLTQGDGWVVRTMFIGLRADGETFADALNAFDAELSQHEWQVFAGDDPLIEGSA